MSFTIGVTVLWTVAKSAHGSNLPIVAFALTGYSSVLLWRNMPTRCITAIEPNLSLLYHKNVKVLDLFLARLLLEGGGVTISFSFLGILFYSIGWLDAPDDLLKVVAGWLLLAWFGSALAISLGAMSYKYELIDKIWHPVSYLMFPLSGAAFLVDILPKKAQELILYIPMIHGVELLREGYFGSKIHAHYDMNYMIPLCSALTLFGLIQVKSINRIIRPT